MAIPRSALRPLIADDTRVLVRLGLETDPAIYLYRYDLTQPEVLANRGMGFTELGNGPGISDDGKICAFYGNDAQGPGIFATMRTTGIPVTRRVADKSNGFSSFAGGLTRVGVNTMAGSQITATVVYLATKDGKEGIYCSLLTFPKEAAQPWEISSPRLVTESGDILYEDDNGDGVFQPSREKALGGTVKALKMYDPVNSKGEIAFWVQTDTGEQGIIWARPKLPITIATFDPGSMQMTNSVHPGIFRYGGHGAVLTQRHQLLVKISAPPATPLRIYVQAVTNSGGHAHSDTPRRHGYLLTPEQKWAEFPPFYDRSIAGGTSSYSDYDGALIIQSGPSGATNLYYIAPEISGNESIVVSTEDTSPGQRLAATNTVTVAVPALQALTDGPTVTLVGQRCAHPSNHWGTTNMVQALAALAINYFVETGQNEKLPVNDMALPQGGLFDIGPKLPCDDPTNRAFGPFWEYGTGSRKNHFGHRLGTEVDVGLVSKPADGIFERLIREQGWWLDDPKLWVSEGTHYHLNLSGSGQVTIGPPKGDAFRASNVSNGSWTVILINENRGGLNADSVTITQIVAENGVTIQGPVASVNLGAMAIRQKKEFTLQAIVPPNLREFFLRWRGVATSLERPGVSFPFEGRGRYLSKPVRIPSGPSPLSTPSKPFAVGDWEIELTNPVQEAAAGATLIYNANVRNRTGADILLTDLHLALTTPAPVLAYEVDWAQSFLDTGGVIPLSGYSGPLIALRWLVDPPVGSITQGTLELTTDAAVSSSTLRADFTSSFRLQHLRVASTPDAVILSWPLTTTRFVLQTADELEDPEWYEVKGQAVQVGGTNSMTIPTSALRSFYRLSSQ